MDEEGVERRLRWRLRRGVRELDLILMRYFDHRYRTAPPAERAAFAELLDCEDPQLLGWLLGDAPLPGGALGALVQGLRGRPHD
jgi:Uncharacterized conserved protein